MIKANEARLEIISKGFSSAYEGILITDEKLCIQEPNDALLTMMGYEKKEIIGQTPALFKSKDNRKYYKNLWQELNSTGHWAGELIDKRKNQELFPVFVSVTRIVNSDGDVVN